MSSIINEEDSGVLSNNDNDNNDINRNFSILNFDIVDNSSISDDESDMSELDSKSQAEQMKNSKSLQNFSKLFTSFPTPLPDDEVIRYKKSYVVCDEKEDYGIKINSLKQFKVMNEKRKNQIIAQDESLSELALLKTRNYIIFIKKAIKVQTILRMAIPRNKHLKFRRIRKNIKNKFFKAWFQYFRSEFLNLFQHKYKYFLEWRQETRDSKRLTILCSRFFTDCIDKLKLSPQAVMVYFDSSKWGSVIKQDDLTKFRRLILLKLVKEWKKEVLFLKKTRYQACQIIIRCSRSANNHLYETEAALVCFHMWKRYVLVTKAYRNQEPEPRFTNPYLPQWTRLKTEIALRRIHKTRTAEKGQILSIHRSFKRWENAMTLDLAAYLSPWEQACIYNSKKLTNWVLQAWIESIKERGNIQRVQFRCFYKWKKWAPLNKIHKTAKRKLVKIIKVRRTEQAFQSMIELCLDIVGRRTIALRTLRDNVYNRKLMICVFALMNQDHHVMMFDCWRRWFKWTIARVRWKSTLWQYRYLWHTSKQNAIFCAWRDYVTAGMGKSNGFKSPTKKPDMSSPRKMFNCKESSMVDNIIEINNDDLNDDSRSINTYNTFISQNSESSFLFKTPESEREVVDRLMMKSIKANKFDITKFSRPIHSFVEEDTSYFGNSFCPINENLSNIIDVTKVVTYPRMFNCIMSQSLALFEQIQLKGIPTLPDLPAFFLICHCVYLANKKLNNQRSSSLAAYASGVEMTRLQKEGVEEAKNYANIQKKLQYSIDVLNLDEVSTSISEGSIVEASHVHQSGKYIGEEFIPMFCILLSCSTLYLAERIVKKDRESEVLATSDPFKAVILSQHIDRWEHGVLSRRELNLVEHKGIDSEIGGDFSGVTLWRSVVLLMLKRRADLLASTCITLPQSRSIDQEVIEVLKRKKITRLRQIRENIRILLGVEVDTAAKLIDKPPQLVLYDDEAKEKKAASIAIFKNNQKDVDIYEVLFEYTQMIGKLAREAKALREPLMERDLNLIRNGFLKQSRSDFLTLRKDCMTPKDIENARLKLLRIKEKNARIRKKKELKEKRLQKAKEAAEKKRLLKEVMEEKKSAAKSSDNKLVPKNTKTIDTEVKIVSEDEVVNDKIPIEEEEGIDDDAKENQSDNDDDSDNSKFQEMHGLTLEEESHMKEENDFQARTNDTIVHGKKGSRKFIFETWIPRYKKSVIVAQETIKTRIIKESNKILNRIHKELFDDVNFPDKITTDKYSGKGGWLIISNIYYEEPFDWKLWLPPAWFMFGNILGKIEVEKSIIAATILVIKSKIKSNESLQKDIEDKNTKLSKFLSLTKKSVIETASYKIKKKIDDEQNRASRLRDVQSSERAATAIKATAQVLADKIKSAEGYFKNGCYDMVYQIFGKKLTLEFDEESKFKALTNADMLIEKNKETLIIYMTQVSDALARLRKYNLELLSYDRFCTRSSNWLKSMAQSKFNSMIDVHGIVTRNIDNNKDIKKSSESQEKILDQLLKYNNIITSYSFSIAKENQNALEEKEMQRFENEKRANLGSKAYLYDLIKKEQEASNPEKVAANKKPTFRRPSFSNILPLFTYEVKGIVDKSASIIENDDEIETIITAEDVGENTDHVSQDNDNESQSSEHTSKSIQRARKTLMEAQMGPDKDEPTEKELVLMNTKVNNKAMQKAIDDELARIADEKLQTANSNALRTRTFDSYWMLSDHIRPVRKKHNAIFIKRDEFGAIANEEDIDSDTDEDDEPEVILNKTKRMWAQIAKSRLKRQMEIAKRAMLEGAFDAKSYHSIPDTVIDENIELPMIPRVIKAIDYKNNEEIWKSSASAPAFSQGFSQLEYPGHEVNKILPIVKRKERSNNKDNFSRNSTSIDDDKSVDDSSTIESIDSSHVTKSSIHTVESVVDIFIEAARNQHLLFKTSSNRILNNITALDYNCDVSLTFEKDDEDHMNDYVECDDASVLSGNTVITKSINDSNYIDDTVSEQSSITKLSVVLSVQSDLFNNLNSQKSPKIPLHTFDEDQEEHEDDDNSTIITTELSLNFDKKNKNDENNDCNNEKLDVYDMDSLHGDSDMFKAPILEPLQPENSQVNIEAMNSKLIEESSDCNKSIETFEPLNKVLKPSEISSFYEENADDSILSSNSSSSSDDDDVIDNLVPIPFISVLTEEGRKTLNKQRKVSRKNSALAENLEILEMLYTKDGKPTNRYDAKRGSISMFQIDTKNSSPIPNEIQDEMSIFSQSLRSHSSSVFDNLKATYKPSSEQEIINKANMLEYGVEHPILLPYVSDIGIAPPLPFALFKAPGKTKSLIVNVEKDIYDLSGFSAHLETSISIITLSKPMAIIEEEKVNMDIGKRKKSNNHEKNYFDLSIQGTSDFGRKKPEKFLQPVVNNTLFMPVPGPLDYLNRSKDNQIDPIIKSSALTVGIIFKKIETPQSAKLVKYIENELFLIKNEKRIISQNLIESFDDKNIYDLSNNSEYDSADESKSYHSNFEQDYKHVQSKKVEDNDDSYLRKLSEPSVFAHSNQKDLERKHKEDRKSGFLEKNKLKDDNFNKTGVCIGKQISINGESRKNNQLDTDSFENLKNKNTEFFGNKHSGNKLNVIEDIRIQKMFQKTGFIIGQGFEKKTEELSTNINKKSSDINQLIASINSENLIDITTEDSNLINEDNIIQLAYAALLGFTPSHSLSNNKTSSNFDSYADNVDFFNSNPYNESILFSFQEGFSESNDLNNSSTSLNKSYSDSNVIEFKDKVGQLNNNNNTILFSKVNKLSSPTLMSLWDYKQNKISKNNLNNFEDNSNNNNNLDNEKNNMKNLSSKFSDNSNYLFSSFNDSMENEMRDLLKKDKILSEEKLRKDIIFNDKYSNYNNQPIRAQSAIEGKRVNRVSSPKRSRNVSPMLYTTQNKNGIVLKNLVLSESAPDLSKILSEKKLNSNLETKKLNIHNKINRKRPQSSSTALTQANTFTHVLPRPLTSAMSISLAGSLQEEDDSLAYYSKNSARM